MPTQACLKYQSSPRLSRLRSSATAVFPVIHILCPFGIHVSELVLSCYWFVLFVCLRNLYSPLLECFQWDFFTLSVCVLIVFLNAIRNLCCFIKQKAEILKTYCFTSLKSSTEKKRSLRWGLCSKMCCFT